MNNRNGSRTPLKVVEEGRYQFTKTLLSQKQILCTTFTEKEWKDMIEKEPPDSYHGNICNHYHIEMCNCKGACSCHWKEEETP